MKSAYLTRERTNALDILKLFSAIVIAYFYHYRNDFALLVGKSFPYENTPFWGWWSKQGIWLTDLFFILSGFSFVLAYQKKIEDGSTTFETFIKKRYMRFMPAVISSTIFMSVMAIVHCAIKKLGVLHMFKYGRCFCHYWVFPLAGLICHI